MSCASMRVPTIHILIVDVETLDMDSILVQQHRVSRQHLARGKCDRTGLHTPKFQYNLSADLRLIRDHIILRPVSSAILGRHPYEYVRTERTIGYVTCHMYV